MLFVLQLRFSASQKLKMCPEQVTVTRFLTVGMRSLCRRFSDRIVEDSIQFDMHF